MKKIISATERDGERIAVPSIPKRYQILYSGVLILLTILYLYCVMRYGDFSGITNRYKKTIVIVDYMSRFIPVAVWVVFICESIGVLFMLLANFIKEQIIREREQRENMIREEVRWQTIERLFAEFEKRGIEIEGISMEDFLDDNGSE